MRDIVHGDPTANFGVAESRAYRECPFMWLTRCCKASKHHAVVAQSALCMSSTLGSLRASSQLGPLASWHEDVEICITESPSSYNPHCTASQQTFEIRRGCGIGPSSVGILISSSPSQPHFEILGNCFTMETCSSSGNADKYGLGIRVGF